MSDHYPILIVGGGTAGITVAARLNLIEEAPEVGLIEPSDKHYYQPIWTLVGGGVVKREVSVRPEADYIPERTTWIRDAVADFDPEHNAVTTESGKRLTYDVLVVAPGIKLDWDKVKGLRETIGKDGVCSNYSFDTVNSTWKFLDGLSEGHAIFTFPSTPIKCGGAPQKIMWLAEDLFRRKGIRDKVRVTFASSTAAIFGVPHYAKTLAKLVEQRDVHTHFERNLIEVRPSSREAVFESIKEQKEEELVLKYDVLHVTPPQCAPDFIRRSPLADADGWVDVDMYTTQHNTYPNVFSLGDASSLPNAKTGAAVRKQAPVTVANLMAYLNGDELKARYNGYASCPLVTGYGRLILAEFGYDGKVMETFPFDQSQERYSMWVLKLYGLPSMYWNGMLRGRM